MFKKGGFFNNQCSAFPHLYSKFDKDVGHYRRYTKNSFNKILKGLNFQSVKFLYYELCWIYFIVAFKISN